MLVASSKIARLVYHTIRAGMHVCANVVIAILLIVHHLFLLLETDEDRQAVPS